jgi:UTP--glucose-1-phosphate uridylyltransferase
LRETRQAGCALEGNWRTDLPGAGHDELHAPAVEPLGLGHAVWCAREHGGAMNRSRCCLPDMVMKDSPSCLAQMLDAYADLPKPANLLATEQVPMDKTHQYGVVGVGEEHGTAFEITQMVEKPAPGTAPSNHIISGRYLLQPEIFALLSDQQTGAGGEIQITDAMIRLSHEQPFYGYHFQGESFDCGSKLGFLSANVAFAMDRPDLGPELRSFLRTVLD